jgi:hypothetical protein
MKPSACIFFFSLTLKVSLAQSVCFQLVDASTRQPVPYAAVSCKNCNYGFFSDLTGNICFAGNNVDTISISLLSYQPLSIAINQIKNNDTLTLSPQPFTLQPVNVARRRIHNQTLGPFRKGTMIVQNSYCPNSSALVAVYIPNSQENPSTISKVHYRLSPKPSEIALAFRCRIHIWTDTSGKPGSALLPMNHILDIKPNQKVATVDVSQYAIPFPANGAWIGIEAIGYINKQNEFIANGNQFGTTLRRTNRLKILSLSPGYMVVPSENKYPNLVKFWNHPWHTLKTQRIPSQTFSFGVEVVY